MPYSAQNLDANDLLAQMSGGGYRGITAAADGTTASQLDITIANSGIVYGLLGDGTFLTAATLQALIGTSAVKLTGNTVNGTYKLWLDASTDSLNTPVFSVSAAGSPPSTRAIAVGTVTVASNVISAYAATTAGVTL